MKNVGEVIDLSESYLREHGVISARREAEDLLALVLQKKRIDLYLDFTRPLTEEELAHSRKLLKKRAEGVPFGYLAKQVAFFGTLLEITPAVLVPRPETEILVAKVAAEIEKKPHDGKVLLDLCTGSGCIGIALKKRFPGLQVVLSDISEAALAVAKANAERNRVEVEIRQGDLSFADQKCHFLVCNPPYLSEAEYQAASKELTFEPKEALVAAEEGYAFYRRVSEELPTHLEEGGKAFFEIGYTQSERVINLFTRAGYQSVHCESDFAGHPRFFFLE